MTIDLDAPVAAPARPPARGRWIAAVALAAVAVGVAVYVGGRPPPSEVPPSHDFTGRLQWIASLVDAAPRGSVASDPSFARDLADRIEELSERSSFGGLTSRWPEPRRARVLFAEDIDDRRIALVSLQRLNVANPVRRYALTDLLWLVNTRGASIESLLRPVVSGNQTPDAEYRVEPVAPFPVFAFDEPANPILVALAPPSCQIATAPAADLTAWQPAADGSYLVRRPWENGPEYWRVTCDGVIREERPAPRPAVSEQDLDALLATTTDQAASRKQLESQVSALTSAYGSRLLTLPRVVHSGGLAFSPTAADAGDIYYEDDEPDLSRPAAYPIETTVTIVSAPAARGGFIVSVWTTLHEGPRTMYFVQSLTFATRADPAAADSLIAVRMDRWRQQVLVLPPARAATVRLLDDGGQVIDESPVADEPVMLAAGEPGPSETMRVEALDARGARVATTELSPTDIDPDITLAWE